MKRNLLVILAVALLSCSQPEKPPALDIFGEIAVIPRPTNTQRLGGYFELSPSTVFVSQDEGMSAATNLNEWLSERYGFVCEISNTSVEGNSVAFKGLVDAKPEAGEGYSLQVEPEAIQLTGTPSGMFYGVQTLIQLLPVNASSPLQIPAAKIDDHPRFKYRGMHLDVARHFVPVENVKEFIGLMARYKFNYFHWHLTDDQGWRIQINKYPRLTEIGAKRRETVREKMYSPYVGDGKPVEGFYTQDEIRDVVAYAKARHVKIIPEIDMPGHSSAALAAHPELGCRENYSYQVKTTWGGFQDILCPKEDTFQFIEDVLDETIELFADSPYIHIGGDEVDTAQWQESPVVRELSQRENLNGERDVQRWFLQRVANYIQSKGKRVIGWDEILDTGASSDVTIMVWQDHSRGRLAASRSHDVIMTPWRSTYFDYRQGDAKDEPLTHGPEQVTLETVYGFDPLAEMAGVDERRIIGGQGCIWTEFIKTPEHLEYMAFPRAIALAEVLWSRAADKDFPDFNKRLSHEFARLDRSKVNYRVPEPAGLRDRVLFGDEKAIVNMTTALPGGKIFYTTDGSTPTARSFRYAGAFILQVPAGFDVEVKAIAISSAGRTSLVKSCKYSRPGPSGMVTPRAPLAPMPRQPLATPKPSIAPVEPPRQTSPKPTPQPTK